MSNGVFQDKARGEGHNDGLSRGRLTDLVLFDLVLGPRLFVSLVEKDGLIHVVRLRLGLVELVLKVGAVKAHLLRQSVGGLGGASR